MPDDHSKSVPPLPIPNRTVKRLRADDSASTRVKVGHRQASYTAENKTPLYILQRGFAFEENIKTGCLVPTLMKAKLTNYAVVW